MSTAMELALLVLHRGVSDFQERARRVLEQEEEKQEKREREVEETLGDLGDDQLIQFGSQQLALVQSMSVADALRAAARETDSPRPVDRFGAAQAFDLGVRYSNLGVRFNLVGEDEQAEVVERLNELSGALVAPFRRGRTEEAAGNLIEAVSGIQGAPGAEGQERIASEALQGLSSAFGPGLRITGDAATDYVDFSGPAASEATLLVELARKSSGCRLDADGTCVVDGQPKRVTLIEIDVCTNLSMERCKFGIDPTRWPDCNPYFQSVRTIGPVQRSPNGDGWAGAIKERVGPGLNLSVYETDLAVRYFEGSGIAAVAFDLVPAAQRTDDRRVTVDRGFLSVTNEGMHRRVRVLKVYRIEDLDTPHMWLCPLWGSQVVMSGWWC